eukprot:TRINITY_DN4070_c0_g1_i3.p1 TRINITY_DN4070_c0_g1~~TRINITY_DN4070_c0_g1_i3.p1  ORF type:complete len:629 (+),score=164.89 TRINITY_DN4070_c0_g1_i3:55-1941(+)
MENEVLAAATPSGRHRQQVDVANRVQHKSTGEVGRARPLAASLDWPLSKDEKRKCALQLYERDVKVADALLSEREQEVGELKKELQVLRRLSFSSTTCAPSLLDSDLIDDDIKSQAESTESPRAPCDAEAAAESAETELSRSAEEEDAPIEEETGRPETDAGSETRQHRSSDPPRSEDVSPREALLLAALLRYFNERRRQSHQPEITEASAEMREHAKTHGGSEAAVASLWSSIGERHNLPAAETLSYLARSLPLPAEVGSTAERAQIWRRSLLQAGRGSDADASPEARRASYLELRSKLQVHGEIAAALRVEAESECRAAWKGESFMAEPGVAEAVASVCLTVSLQRERHVRGSAEVAALLLFAFLPSECMAQAEADAFWCLSQLLTEVKGGLADDCHDGGGAGGAAAAAATASKAKRMHALLRSTDQVLAELLIAHGLCAMPASRLGAAFLTRAGFPLQICALLWDVVLADSQRFALCDCIVVALLLINRQKLLQMKGDCAGMAEVLLSSPKETPVNGLLRVALAVRALDRRRRAQAGTSSSSGGVRTQSQPPARQEGPGVIRALGSLWGRVRAKGADAIEAGRTAARCAWPQAEQAAEVSCDQQASEEMQPLRKSTAAETPPCVH